MLWEEEEVDSPLVIAIDGPAASGKGTLAKRLAKHLGLPYLDTGCLYRAVAYKLLTSQQNPEDYIVAESAAKTITISDIENPSLQTEEIGQAASIVASIPAVRQALLQFQRDFAANPQGAVLDGRDIGTVVCPDADIKLFITADTSSRAERRFKELQHKGIKVIYEEILADLQERDKRDSKRQIAPLVVAKDAFFIDTTGMDPGAVLDRVLSLVTPYLKTSTTT